MKSLHDTTAYMLLDEAVWVKAFKNWKKKKQPSYTNTKNYLHDTGQLIIIGVKKNIFKNNISLGAS